VGPLDVPTVGGVTVQRWLLHADGRHHRVEADTGGWRKRLRWWVDDELVAERTTAEDRVDLRPDDDHGDGPGHGTVALRFSALGRPRRATWYAAGEGTDAALGVGGVDLEPEDGSPAALHEARVREHPVRYQVQRTAAGVAGVLLPVLLGLVVVRLAVQLPWPDWDLPSLPWPDWSLPLPSIPWPDWSLPDLPDLPEPPGWVQWVLDHARYVWPVVLALVLARAEVRRRRRQDRLREERGRREERDDRSGTRP
jgi:hypothetical protein